MLFTPMNGLPEESSWLPKIPAVCARAFRGDKAAEEAELLKYAKVGDGIELSPLGIVDGQESLFQSLQLPAQLIQATPEQVKTYTVRLWFIVV